MKKAIALAMLITAVALSVSGQTANDEKTDKEIKQANAREVEALLHNDVKTLASIWSDGFVVTNPFNKFLNKQQVVGLVEAGMLAFTSYDRQVEYMSVYGNTAVVAGSETVVWGGKMPNAGQTSRLRFTTVWMKRDGRWQQVARHASMVNHQ
jgi:Domain of unknown function (DUF4440)